MSCDKIKEKFILSPILQCTKWNNPFHIQIDLSDKELGVVFFQQENKDPFAIYFISKSLYEAKINYIFTKK
jgi:hypothetical protein